MGNRRKRELRTERDRQRERQTKMEKDTFTERDTGKLTVGEEEAVTVFTVTPTRK